MKNIGSRAKPFVHEDAIEIQPYGMIVKLPIALSEKVCAKSVENLNQVLADTMTLRDLYKKHHWQVAGTPSTSSTFFSTSTSASRASSSTP